MTPFYFDGRRMPVDWEDGASVVVANPEWTHGDPARLSAVQRQLPALDAHIWVATSGTSAQSAGSTRWVALSKAAFLTSARAVNAHLGSSPSDVWAHALPLFHVGGLGILARAHVSGARVVPAVAGRWNPAAYRDAVAASGASLSALVPSQVHDLVAARLDAPPSLRAIVIGGARLEPPLYLAARELGWPCLPSYGLTETCSQVATAGLDSLGGQEYPAALPVLGHAEIRAGDDGRLSIRAGSLLTCCAETGAGETRVWDPKRDGWFETEDLGRVVHGLVEVLGRASESVKVLGELVSVPAVEARAWEWATGEGLRTEAGFDLAVVVLPHDRYGHALALAISAPSVSPDERAALESSVAAFGRRALLPFERFQRVAWVDRIPRTPLGKVQRPLLAREVGE